jgi:hypothetical protein
MCWGTNLGTAVSKLFSHPGSLLWNALSTLSLAHVYSNCHCERGIVLLDKYCHSSLCMYIALKHLLMEPNIVTPARDSLNGNISAMLGKKYWVECALANQVSTDRFADEVEGTIFDLDYVPKEVTVDD